MREIKCTNCLMQFKEDVITEYNGELLCPTCLDEYEADDWDWWAEDYACENLCCACCGCSCGWDEEEDLLTPFLIGEEL